MECFSNRAKCSKCNKHGHMDKYCQSQSDDSDCESDLGDNRNSRPRKLVGKVEVTYSNPKAAAVAKARRRYVDVQINDCNLSLRLDTGSDVTVINEAQWQQLGAPYLEKIDCDLVDAISNSMEAYGKFECKVRIGDFQGIGDVYVTPNTSVLGRDWLDKCDSTSKIINHITGIGPDKQNAHHQKEQERLSSKTANTIMKFNGNCRSVKKITRKKIPNTKSRDYNSGDSVWIKKYQGGYYHWLSAKVTTKISSKKYEVNLDGKPLRRYLSQIRCQEHCPHSDTHDCRVPDKNSRVEPQNDRICKSNTKSKKVAAANEHMHL